MQALRLEGICPYKNVGHSMLLFSKNKFKFFSKGFTLNFYFYLFLPLTPSQKSPAICLYSDAVYSNLATFRTIILRYNTSIIKNENMQLNVGEFSYFKRSSSAEPFPEIEDRC